MRKLFARLGHVATVLCAITVAACATAPDEGASQIDISTTEVTEMQPISDPPRIWGHFESGATHPISAAVEIYDDHITLGFATFYTERVGAFDARRPWRAASPESWAEHWAFRENNPLIEHFVVAELRRVTRVEPSNVSNGYCGLHPVEYIVVVEGRRTEAPGWDMVRAVIVPFNGEPSETTECGMDNYFNAARTPQS